MCPDRECDETGKPVAWSTPNLSYAFNRRGFPGIADADLRRIFAASIAPWLEVTCDGEPIELTVEQDPLPTDAELGPIDEEPNDNAIVYFDAARWQEESLGHSAFAVTKVWFDGDTGELLGADMLFNDSMGPFGECPPEGCPPNGPRADIQIVATHEFGHFLGLAHSNEPDATMFCQATGRDVELRTLSADDREGLCAVYPPGKAFEPPKRKRDKGCALGAEASGGWPLLALWLRRRRRR